MERRIAIDGSKLAATLQVWFRELPPWAWGSDPAYEKMRKEKRHDPDAEPKPQRMVARLIVAKMEELGYEVTLPEPPAPVDLSSPPQCERDRT